MRATCTCLPAALASAYADEALADCDALGILRAHHYPRVTDHLPEIVAVIQRLLERGHAYATPGGSVYFRVRAWPWYGSLSGRDPAAAVETRVGPDPAKEFGGDFALWKAIGRAEPSWESPWGRGRPGWHIECSAMSGKYLGQVDIHGGALELLFPHHENELAQTEACSGVRPGVRYWAHCGVVNVGGRKMAKSRGE